MQEMSLRTKIRRKRHVHIRQTVEQGQRIAENLLNRGYHAEAPNQKWVTDVTYIPTTEGWLYLSPIMDLFDNEIIRYCVQDRNDNTWVLQTVKQDFESRKNATGVILHSDRGFRYTSHGYHDMLQKVSPESACLVKPIVMTTPVSRASSPILKQKNSTSMIYQTKRKHKEELESIFVSTMKNESS